MIQCGQVIHVRLLHLKSPPFRAQEKVIEPIEEDFPPGEAIFDHCMDVGVQGLCIRLIRF